MKHHLAGTRQNAIECPQYPGDVKATFLSLLMKARAKMGTRTSEIWISSSSRRSFKGREDEVKKPSRTEIPCVWIFAAFDMHRAFIQCSEESFIYKNDRINNKLWKKI